MMSAGSRSGVICILLNSPPISCAIVFAIRVFPTPGTPSSSMCPSLRIAISIASNTSFFPIIISEALFKIFSGILCSSVCSKFFPPLP